MADYVTTAKFGMTLSEPWELSKSDYMTTAHFFAHQWKFLDTEWLTRGLKPSLKRPYQNQRSFEICLHDYSSFFHASIRYFGLILADYVTRAKFWVTPSEPGELKKSDYMTTANFFWIKIGWLRDYSQNWQDPIRNLGIFKIWVHDYS